MNENMNLQDAILKEVRREKVPVTLFLMNGFQLRGVITGFDSFVVVLVSDGKQHITVLQGKISCSRSCSAAPARKIQMVGFQCIYTAHSCHNRYAEKFYKFMEFPDRTGKTDTISR